MNQGYVDAVPLTPLQQQAAARWHQDTARLDEIRSVSHRLEMLGAVGVAVSTLAAMAAGFALTDKADGTTQTVVSVVWGGFGFWISFTLHTRQRLMALTARFVSEKVAGR